MNTQDFKRKLTAIMSADVSGYSRLMGDNEAETVKTLEAYKRVMYALIKQHRGRVVDSPGDNLLAEFASVVDAVQCGMAVQNELKARNAELPQNRRMEFRIGINLGDVIEEGERICGDGVNIAARLESCADPGGICVSKTAFDHIETKLPLGYEYLGEKEVKNIPKPVGAYRVLMEPRVTVAGVEEKKHTIPLWRRTGILSGALAVLVVIIGVSLWNFYFRFPTIEPASKEKMAFPLPDKPSIAVMPFTNMSGDPNQEFFSDGITENIITGLAQIRTLFVIARNSTFTYKGKPVKVQQVAEDLGVRYVLEGSVQKSGDRLRITAQFIDALKGQHLWAERYDGTFGDVFALQDKINHKIVAALAVKLTEGEKAHVEQKWTNNPTSYDEYLKGREYASRLTADDYDKAEACYKKALDLDPNFTQARAALASMYLNRAQFGLGEKSRIAYLANRLWAVHHLREAMREPTPLAYRLSGDMDLLMRMHDAAISKIDKALSLDPNDPDIHGSLSWALCMIGRPAEAIEHAKRAMRLDPVNPDRYLYHIGVAQFCLGNMEEAATLLERALKLNPEQTVAAGPLAAAHAHLGRTEEARAACETLRKDWGDTMFIVPGIMNNYPFRDRGVADAVSEGLKKAGIPGVLLRRRTNMSASTILAL
jgi:TolB-like protein/class 3 adenylate cyclase/thioredoxin-like negative regulator of GroEL